MNAPLVRTLATLLVALLLSARAFAAPNWPIPEGVKTVEVNGYPMAYVEAGSGPVLLVVHGAWIDHRLFNGVVAQLSGAYRVIVPSLRHYWPEPWDGTGDDFSYSQHANDLAAFVRALGLGKVHLLGHSRGGGVALTVALRNPEFVRSLVLAEPAHLDALLPDPSVAVMRRETNKRFGAMIRASLQAGEERAAVAKKAWDVSNGPGSWDRMPENPQRMIAANIATMSTDVPSEVIAANCDDLRRLTMPVLLVQSEGAAKNYLDAMAAALQCRPDWSPMAIVPKARHNMFLDNPASFNEQVTAFLARN